MAFPLQKDRPSLPEGQILYDVDDIHGRLDRLGTVFQRIDQDRANYSDWQVKEIFLGDYIDRGTQSCQVIDTAIARKD